MAIFRKITPEMESLDMGWMTITYDDQVRKMKAKGANLEEMTADATKKMWEVVQPGRKRAHDYYNTLLPGASRHVPNPREPINVQDNFIYTPCGTIASTIGLLLVNSGIKNLKLLSCKTYYESQPAQLGGHTALLIGESKEFPYGALLQVDKNHHHHWCELEPGALEYFNQIDNAELPQKVVRLPILTISDDTTRISFEPFIENDGPEVAF